MSPDRTPTTVATCAVLLLLSLRPNQTGTPGVDAGASDRQFQYKQDLEREIELLRGVEYYRGHLDAQGNFIPNPGEKPHPVNAAFSGPEFELINGPAQLTEVVYEYRSGALIRGTLDLTGNFSPQVGGTVISFQEYLRWYDPKRSPRIYNLPGRIVPKGDDASKGEGPGRGRGHGGRGQE